MESQAHPDILGRDIYGGGGWAAHTLMVQTGASENFDVASSSLSLYPGLPAGGAAGNNTTNVY